MKIKYILIGIIVLIIAVFSGIISNCQSGMFSRIGLGDAKLPIPKDCVRVINFGKNGSKKYISYLTADGILKIKEYSDIGFLEATYRITGAVFNKDLTIKTTTEKNK